MLEFKYDTQLLIEGENLDEDKISEYFTNNFNGDCLLAVGDEELIKIHFHTNEPWKVLEYCSQPVSYTHLLLAEKLGVPVVNTFSGCPGGSPEDKTPNWVTCPWPDEDVYKRQRDIRSQILPSG